MLYVHGEIKSRYRACGGHLGERGVVARPIVHDNHPDPPEEHVGGVQRQLLQQGGQRARQVVRVVPPWDRGDPDHQPVFACADSRLLAFLKKAKGGLA